MKAIFPRRLLWLLWIACLTLFFAVWLSPVSSVRSRLSGIVLFLILWIGLIALTWRARFLRFALIGITMVCGIFALMPSRGHRDVNALRLGYVGGLLRYEGCNYYWGGESPKGIDCSGLIRRGLIDSLFLRGIRTFDPGLCRYAVWVWWHDCTANDLGLGKGLTSPILITPSLNTLNASSTPEAVPSVAEAFGKSGNLHSETVQASAD